MEVAFERTVGEASTMRQVVRLDACARRLEFHTEVDWHEEHSLLKVCFPLAVRAPHATYEMQFGYTERPTHYSTSHDRARYEVPGHRFADLSEHGFGAALLTDCKYGYSCYGNELRISLLRASKSPDPEADMGRHEFAYALLPHAGGWREAGVVAEAARFNQPLRWGESVVPTQSRSYASADDPNLVLDTIKRAEDSDAIVLRLYEAHGARGVARVRLALPFDSAHRANALEDVGDELEVDGDTIVVPYRPHEIVTVARTMTHVVCIGLATLDTILAVPSHPGPDDRVVAIELVVAGGGPAATAAVALARARRRDVLRRRCRRRRRRTADPHRPRAGGHRRLGAGGDSGARSPQSTILVGGDDRAIVHFRGDAHLELSERARELCRTAAWVHVDHVGYAVAPREARLSIDGGNPIDALDLAGVALYAPTERGSRTRFGSAEAALDAGAELVVVTSGAGGSTAYTRDETIEAAGHQVKVVSTLGAGDVFHGALLAQLVRDAALPRRSPSRTRSRRCRAARSTAARRSRRWARSAGDAPNRRHPRRRRRAGGDRRGAQGRRGRRRRGRVERAARGARATTTRPAR